MLKRLPLSALLLGAAPLAAQTLTIDPHLDLPKSALSPGWTGRTDPTSQFDLDRAKHGGLNAAAVALFVPQGPRDPASLATAQVELRTRDAAIHAIVERNPGRAALALSPGDERVETRHTRYMEKEAFDEIRITRYLVLRPGQPAEAAPRDPRTRGRSRRRTRPRPI